MADDRNRNDDSRGRPYGSEDRYRYGREDASYAARDYGAGGGAGPRDDRNYRSGGTGYGGGSHYGQGRERGDDRDYSRSSYGQQRFGGGAEGHQERDRDHRASYGRHPEGYRYQDRGFIDRAGDEVRSWFGDDDAERRREMDQRNDERMSRSGGHHDADYHSWRRTQIDALDRDYDEYRRENASRFHSEFGAFRTERESQRGSLARVAEHMEVVGSDGGHVGKVDKVRGDRIILAKNDEAAGGHHHSIPSRWIDRVDDKVTIRKTAEEAKNHWRDEEQSGAMFGGGDRADREPEGKVDLNRSFSGTY